MSTDIFAIVIGVSTYQSKKIENLSAAKQDAILFARSLFNWGIPESNIALLCDSDALVENLEQELKKLNRKTTPFQLVFYFCGHGLRIKGSSPRSYLLFHESKIEKDSILSSIGLDTLSLKISELNCTNTFLFIDACHLRLNSIINPKLKEEIEGSKESSRNFFCILSSGVHPSFEDAIEGYGYFTNVLLKGLSIIRVGDLSPNTLIKFINKELQTLDLPCPEVYNIGIEQISFLKGSLSSFFFQGHIYRSAVIAESQDLLIKNRKKFLFITGVEGIGKSTIARQITSNKFQSYLIQLDHHVDILKQIEENMAAINIKAKEKTLKDYLNELEKRMPYSHIIIDNIHDNHIKQLLSIFPLLKNRKLFFSLFSRPAVLIQLKKLISDFCEYEIPPLTYKETHLISQESSFKERIDVVHLISQGNPKKIKQALFNPTCIASNTKEFNEIKKAIAAIYSCGMYVNEVLFIKVFQLKHKTLELLEKYGLIYRKEGCLIPHDLLVEIAETESIDLDPQKAIEYWSQQIDELPNHYESAYNLIITVKCFGYEKKLDPYLKMAFKAISQKKFLNVDILLEGAMIYLDHSSITSTSLFLTELLIDRGEFSTAEKLLSIKYESEQYRTQINVLLSNLLWRKGNFDRCVSFTSELIQSSSPSSNQVCYYVNRAISYYLLGDWKNAFTDFSLIHEKFKSQKYVGWSRCMLGSILGIRGIDIVRGKELMESGIRILIKLEDLSSAWVGWNNLGEMMWKIGEYRSSMYYLQKAFEIANSSENPSMRIESQRNLIHTLLRAEGPYCSELSKILEKVEEEIITTCEPFERMQVFNTLSTAYIYLGNYSKARTYLKQAISATANNREYHIYTLSNLALLFKLHGLKIKGDQFYKRAFQLAKKGDNLLAIKQIESDHSSPIIKAAMDEMIS